MSETGKTDVSKINEYSGKKSNTAKHVDNNVGALTCKRRMISR